MPTERSQRPGCEVRGRGVTRQGGCGGAFPEVGLELDFEGQALE